jgi:hypothetical protein
LIVCSPNLTPAVTGWGFLSLVQEREAEGWLSPNSNQKKSYNKPCSVTSYSLLEKQSRKSTVRFFRAFSRPALGQRAPCYLLKFTVLIAS